MLTRKLGTLLVAGFMLLSGTAFAETSMNGGVTPPRGQQGQQGGQGRGANASSRVPPEFAISACKGKSEGTVCEMTGPNGAKTGTCVYTPDKKYFACRPNDMRMSGPPPQ